MRRQAVSTLRRSRATDSVGGTLTGGVQRSASTVVTGSTAISSGHPHAVRRASAGVSSGTVARAAGWSTPEVRPRTSRCSGALAVKLDGAHQVTTWHWARVKAT